MPSAGSRSGASREKNGGNCSAMDRLSTDLIADAIGQISPAAEPGRFFLFLAVVSVAIAGVRWPGVPAMAIETTGKADHHAPFPTCQSRGSLERGWANSREPIRIGTIARILKKAGVQGPRMARLAGLTVWPLPGQGWSKGMNERASKRQIPQAKKGRKAPWCG